MRKLGSVLDEHGAARLTNDMRNSEHINPMSKAQVGRLYDFLHTSWAEARDAYMAADRGAEEEFYRGRREAMDAVLTELDTFMDEHAGLVE